MTFLALKFEHLVQQETKIKHAKSCSILGYFLNRKS